MDHCADPVRWGILATGGISTAFARDLALTPGAELAAVGSRTPASAERFAAEHGAARAHGTYEDLVADPEVDVVYIGTPHARHLQDATSAFAAGKHVLCEKPLAMNLREAEEMVSLARRHDRFVMEAMWMALHPLIRAIVDGLAAGRFGEPRQLTADLGFPVGEGANARLVDRDLGAGALLDVGIYPLTLAYLMLGPAQETRALGVVGEGGYDLDVAVTGRHPGGALSALTASMTAVSPRNACIATTTGRIDLPADFHSPTQAWWTPEDGEPEPIEASEPLIGRGYGNEAAEVQRCLRAGLRESPLVPHAQTLTLMRQMDLVRSQVGVRYAADDAG